MLLEKINKPTLLVDENICVKNIKRMFEKANAAGAILRPHFKTHQSATIGEWFRNFGIEKCTVSSVDMAKYFADNGWNDITIAFPYNLREISDINKLAKKINLNILIESNDALDHLVSKMKFSCSYFLKIDVGTHRTGINSDHDSLILELISKSTDNVLFKGFLAHAGHTYSPDIKYTTSIFENSIKTLKGLKSKYGGLISYGDTPSCSIVEDFSEIDEIRAGNFAFYDWMQLTYGSCDINDIAICLAAPVVSLHPERNEVLICGGGVHLSKDFLELESGKTYGKVVRLTENGWENEVVGNLSRISQEHGIIHPEINQFDNFKIGDLIGIIPIHSCLAADLQGSYFSTSGNRIEKFKKI